MNAKILLESYVNRLSSSILSVDSQQLELLFQSLVKTITSSGSVVLLGNGGSFANASHIAGDYQKTFSSQNTLFTAIGENYCAASAFSNDISYDQFLCCTILSHLKPHVDTLVIFLSGSGNSENLIQAANKVNLHLSADITTVSLTAFGGGKLSSIVQLPLIFNTNDMEVAEDSQLAIMHLLKQRLCNHFSLDLSDYPRYRDRITNNQN